MAKIDVVMPQMGESITTGTITKWHKNVGDEIEIDEILFEISTDKVESEIPSPIKGRIAEILYEEGETIDVGLKIAAIEDDLSASIETENTGAKATETLDQPPVLPGEKKESSVDTSEEVKTKRFYTPLVKKLAKDNGVSLSELEGLTGSGAAGRVNKKDFYKFLETRSSGKTQDVKKASKPVAPRVEPMSFDHGANTKVIPMDNMRKAIAKNMVASKLTSPHVNSISEVDLTHLVKFREGFKNEFFKQEGFKVTYTPFIMRAIILALKEFPLVNASIEGDDIIVKKDINLGCAVAVPGNGLVVPVIKNADELSMLGLCRTLNELAEKARAKKLKMDELQGGTFTFTNVGSFGTLMATPVILQPQVGIYAAGVIQKRVMAMADDSIAIRSMMYGTHTYDHRLVDGELGGKFLEAVHRNLREMKPAELF